MVAWNEYKAIAKDRGALALELYVVESTPQRRPKMSSSAFLRIWSTSANSNGGALWCWPVPCRTLRVNQWRALA